MAGTVNDLLEAARLNSGLAQWNWGEFSPATACEEAMATVQPLVNTMRVTFALDAGPEKFPMRGDADAFQRLVVNLAGNARKFTDAGRIDVTVRLLEVDGARWTELTVRDTGCGIAPEIRGRLGQAFALNAGIVGDHHVGGTGLGLAICRGIVSAHDGSIEIESELGRGTCVRVRLRADLPSPVRTTNQVPLKAAA
jgi:signal transduction histidine kinase